MVITEFYNIITNKIKPSSKFTRKYQTTRLQI